MIYLLDTNIISETIKQKPSLGVSKFLKEIPAKSLFLSALTIGEIRKGIERLKNDQGKKQKLILWLENDLMNFFSGRILPIDAQTADKWGFLVGNLNSPASAIDSLIAATAIRHNMILVTRNIADFFKFQLEIFDPWQTEIKA